MNSNTTNVKFTSSAPFDVIEVDVGDEDFDDYTISDIKEVEIFSCASCPFESESIDELDEHIVVNHESLEVEDSDEDFQAVCEEVSKKKIREATSVSIPTKAVREAASYGPQLKSSANIIQIGLQRKRTSQFEISINDGTKDEPSHKRAKKEKSGTHRCGWCNYTTTEKSDMKLHRQTHSTADSSTIYQCFQCPYQTKRKNDMPKHMLGHCTDVEMYNCPECSYKTKRKCDLPKHMLCHKSTDSVPLYKCDFCSYVTKRKGDLPKHVMNHKEKSQIKIFHCVECDYSSSRKNDLHKHMLVHADRQISGVFKCLKCPYASDKLVRFSKHIQSKCQACEDSISPEHIMLEDILDSVDQEGIHVVLPDEDEIEEFQYVGHEVTEEVETEEVNYVSPHDDGLEYTNADCVVEEVVLNGDIPHVLYSDSPEQACQEEVACVDYKNENELGNQGVFNINLGECAVEVPASPRGDN